MLVRGEQKERPRGRRGAAIIAVSTVALLVLGLILVVLLPSTDGGICVGNGPFWLRGYRYRRMGIYPPGFQEYETPATRLYSLRLGDLMWHLIVLK